MKSIINNVIELTITELNEEGFGIGYLNDFKIVTPYAMENEEVKVKITSLFPKYALAELIEIIVKSEFRINADCKYFSQCGGCSIQHFANYQSYKSKILRERLKELDFDAILHPITSVKRNTRRRASFKIVKNKISFSRFHSKDTIAIDQCLLLDPSLNELISPLNDLLSKLKSKISIINILNSDNGIEILFHAAGSTILEDDILLAEFANKFNIARIAWQIENQKPYAVIALSTPQLIFDNRLLSKLASGREFEGESERRAGMYSNVHEDSSTESTDKLPAEVELRKKSNVRIDLPINSFLQATKESGQIMAEIILRHLDQGNKILELYSGCGSFTVPISSKGKIVAYEGNDDACRSLNNASAKYKLAITAISQDLYHNPIESKILDKYSQIVINPPRNGALPQIKEIAKTNNIKKLIVVSCSLTSFIRDAKILLSNNFKLDEIYPIDQFLYSSHLEIIAVFVST